MYLAKEKNMDSIWKVIGDQSPSDFEVGPIVFNHTLCFVKLVTMKYLKHKRENPMLSILSYSTLTGKCYSNLSADSGCLKIG